MEKTKWFEIRWYLGSTSQLRHPQAEPLTVDTADWIVSQFYPNGHTTLTANGSWRDPSGAVVSEPSWILEVLTQDASQANEVAARLRDAYGQSCVLVTVKEVQSVEFI